jgi:hypothetical protein
MQPLDAVLAGIELEIAGQVYEGSFYECRDGSIVGPMIDDGCDPSFGYAAALGGYGSELWLSDGWSRAGDRGRDLIREATPPLIWTDRQWTAPPR